MRRFGAECAVPFGLGRTSDSVLDTSGREGPDYSGGDVGVCARKDRSCLQTALWSLARFVSKL
jgi:hypothetical protein